MHVAVHGAGPSLLLVHGSAADADAWSIQRTALGNRFRVITYDRRGTSRSPLPAGVTTYSVGEHADDAARVIEEHGAGPLVAVGSSFGGVVVLELARRRPDLLRGAVLCEPPLPPSDDGPSVPDSFRTEFHRRRREQGGPAAGEHFLRTVLGDAAFEKIPRAWRDRACNLHEQIALDSDALAAYRVGYATLGEVHVPILLLGGDRSAAYFEPTLAALAAALPAARRVTLRGAGHMMHADAARQFHAELAAFADPIRT